MRKFGAGILLCIAMIGASALVYRIVLAATNISVTNRWAWNDSIGWLDFYSANSVTVTSQKIQGYASSTAGEISLDCATTSVGNICGSSNYSVTNDGMGNLSGWGWSDEFGWVSFDCNNHSGCGASNYRVTIDPNNGTFANYAWNDVVGWISFNCADPGLCGTSSYKVVTSWVATSTSGTLDSTTFDTGVSGGAQINSVLWQGTQPAGTSVKFQFATSNASNGPWTYIGSDGTGSSYYTGGPGVSIAVDYKLHNDKRYFRYRITLVSNQAQTQTPQVDDVIVNWSP